MGPFETERLILRGMVEGDVGVLREIIYRDREVWGEYSSIGDKPELVEKAFRRHCAQASGAEFGRLVVVLKKGTSKVPVPVLPKLLSGKRSPRCHSWK